MRTALAFLRPARRMAVMKALRSPSTSGSDTDHALPRAAALLPFALLAFGFPVLAQDAQDSKVAVWKLTEAGFSYHSSIAIYSCSALQGRVASVLRAVGARDDVDVRVTGCDEFVVSPEGSIDGGWASADRFPSGRDEQFGAGGRTSSDRLFNRRSDRVQMAGVRVRLMMPTEVTPEVIAELDRDKSRRELVSRVTGDPAAQLNVPIAFPARRQPVTLSHGSIGLEPEECELLDQMSTSVFRQLGVRVLSKGPSCNRDQVSRIPPKLTVEAFVGVPFGSGNLPQIPAAGESGPDPSAPPASDAKPSEPASAKPQE